MVIQVREDSGLNQVGSRRNARGARIWIILKLEPT